VKSDYRKIKSSAVVIERLDKVYCCTECESGYLFISDVAEHQENTDHRKKFCEVPLK